MRILVVDDSKMTQVLMQRSLNKWGYEVTCVSNIDAAIDFLTKEAVQFVITDWIMPGGTGPMLCRKIRDFKDSFYTYIIIMTALDDSSAMVEGMDSGADDFIRKPIQLEEMRARIRAGERVLELEKKLQERNQTLLDAQEVIDRDIKLASKMQRGLLPALPSKIINVAFDGLFCPSAQVSGDIFNFFRLDEYHIGFYAIDVAGHGVASAMLSFTLSRLLTPDLNRDSLLKYSHSSAPFYKIVQPTSIVLEDLNQQFQVDDSNSLYFTMVYGVMNLKASSINLCQAGHPSPIYLPLVGPAKFIGDGGFPVGITTLANYESISIDYTPGARLFIYSDGISECMNVHKEMYGSERLLKFIEQHRDLSVNEILKRLNESIRFWHGSEDYYDDVSMLVLDISQEK